MNIEKKINIALDDIRPFLQRDGGDVRLIEVIGDTAKVEFLGYCSSCNINKMTLKSVASVIKESVPEILNVVE